MNDSQPAYKTQNALIEVWEDYIATCQGLADQLKMDPTGFAGAGGLPFSNTWQQFAESLGIHPNSPNDPVATDTLFSNLAPALGATREYQQITQRMINTGIRFQRAYNELMQFGREVSERALRSAQASISSSTTLVSNPTAPYDAWIDGAEAAYAQLAHGEPFARLMGELCNSLSTFKIERGKLLEALARHLDLPSRAEVDTLHRQVSELTLALRRVSLPKDGGS